MDWGHSVQAVFEELFGYASKISIRPHLSDPRDVRTTIAGLLFPVQIGNGSQLVTASAIAKILDFRHQREKRVTLEIVQTVFEELHLQAWEDYSQSGMWNMVHGIDPERKEGMKELEMARKEILQALQAAMVREQRSVACGGRLMSFSRHLLGRGISLRADGSFDGSEGAGLHERRFSTQHRAVWMHEEPYIVFAVSSTPTATLDLLLLPHRSIKTLKTIRISSGTGEEGIRWNRNWRNAEGFVDIDESLVAWRR